MMQSESSHAMNDKQIKQTESSQILSGTLLGRIQPEPETGPSPTVFPVGQVEKVSVTVRAYARIFNGPMDRVYALRRDEYS